MSTPLRLAFTLTAEDHAEALRCFVQAARQRPATRTETTQSLGKYAIYALFAAPVLLLLFAVTADLALAAALTLAIFALHYIAVALYFRWTDAWLGTAYDPQRHGQGVASLTDTGLRLTGPAHEQSWTWSLLRRLHSTDRLHIVEFAGTELLAIPRSAFASAEDDRAWCDAIRRHLPAAD